VGDLLAYRFWEVLADPVEEPPIIVQVSVRATVSSDGKSFDGSADAQVFPMGAGLVAANRTTLHAVRQERSPVR